jgi:uncharacterized DUF497 family protein
MRPRNFASFWWPPGIEEKVSRKHGLTRDEVEDSFFHPGARIRRKGDRYDLYTNTPSGAYIMVFFEFERGEAIVISARPMTARERRSYKRK